MLSKAYLQSASLVLLSACSTQSPCESQGGRCTRVDVDCGSQFLFAGFDPKCEPNSKCCLPREASSCTARGGVCQPSGQPCATGQDPISPANLCGAGSQCCPASLCQKFSGSCITQDLPCGPDDVALLSDGLCSRGNQCCAPKRACRELNGKCAKDCGFGLIRLETSDCSGVCCVEP